MSQPIKIKRRQERQYSAHHLLLETAHRADKRADNQSPGWIYPILEAQTFSILAIESFANTVGDKLIPLWDDFESASILAKLRVICDHLSIPFDKDQEPWSTVRSMVCFRNLVVHAKPRLLIEERIFSQEEAEKREFERPESNLERQLTIGNARHYTKTAKKVRDTILQALTPEQAYGISTDGSFSHSQIYNQP